MWLASLRPDLIVAGWWPAEKADSGLEEGADEKSKKIAEPAPIVGISQGQSIVQPAEGYEALARSLGAGVDDPSIAANKQRFEDAATRFKAAVAAKPNLTAIAMSPADDSRRNPDGRPGPRLGPAGPSPQHIGGPRRIVRGELPDHPPAIRPTPGRTRDGTGRLTPNGRGGGLRPDPHGR